MRMWMINPIFLCRKHLLGEHNEIHKHKPSFEKKHKITGRIFPIIQIEPINMKIRHDIIATEMKRRNYKHKSPYNLPDLSYLSKELLFLRVNKNLSLQILSERCPECKKRINIYYKGLGYKI